MVALGDPRALALHHVEIWELSVAVAASSGLEDRLEFGHRLRELGDLTRDVKDQIITISSLGINTFSFIVHEVRSPLLFHRGGLVFNPKISHAVLEGREDD